MPIKIPDQLPAKKILDKEHVFIMDESRAFHQDIRPLKIAIVNLMPTKVVTEVQLLRLLGNSPLQLDITLTYMESRAAKNTAKEYLSEFYKTFGDIRREFFDGMIVTGAPVEKLAFEEVGYWDELAEVMEWSKTHVTSTLHICWGAQAGLYYHYGVPKRPLERKMFGVFPHTRTVRGLNLFRGFDDVFFAPHSRHTEVRREDILACPGLTLLAESEEAGVYAAISNDGKNIFVTGHSEYDPETLKTEYFRDLDLGLPINIPQNYFPNDDTSREPLVRWRSSANLLFANWLNYYVYQITPYDLSGQENAEN